MDLKELQRKVSFFIANLQYYLEPANMNLSLKRIIAKFLDLVFIFSSTMILCLFIIILSPILPKFILNIILAIVFGLGCLCVLLLDGPYTIAVFDQQSIGKKFLGLKVVFRNSKQSISYLASAKRNMLLASPYFVLVLFCILDMFNVNLISAYKYYIFIFVFVVVCFVSYGVEIYTFLKSPQNIRYGDVFADTIVID